MVDAGFFPSPVAECAQQAVYAVAESVADLIMDGAEEGGDFRVISPSENGVDVNISLNSVVTAFRMT